MGVQAMIKQAQSYALLKGAAGLIAKRGKRVKTASHVVVTKLVKAAHDGRITKAAFLGGLGQILMRMGGKGLHMGGKGLKRLGLKGMGARVGRAGGKLRGTASNAARLSQATKAQATASALPGRKGGKAVRKANKALKRVSTPETEKALNLAKMTGAGGAGLGAYGAASMLSGGDDEE